MAPLTLALPQANVVSVGCLLAIVAVVAFQWRRARSYSRLPPGPRPDWKGSNRDQIPKEKPWLYFERLGQQYPAGYFTVHTGPKPTIVLNSAKAAHELLDQRSNIYSSRPRFVVAGELMTGGDALLFQPYGDRWKRQRKLYHLALNSNASKAYRPIQEAEAKRLAWDFAEQPELFVKHIERFAASNVCAIAYGRRVDDVNVGFIQSIIERMQEVGRVNLPGKQWLDQYPFLQDLPEWMTPYKKTWRKMRQEGNKFWLGLAAVVEQRMADGTAGPSFTRDLIELGDQSGLTEGEFALLSGGIVGAGVETTAGTLSVFVLACVCFPETVRKAQEELDRVLGPGRSPSWEDEENLPYCSAFLKETLRWRPIAVLGGTPHASTQDDVYEGNFIPAGSTIIANTWSINRDPEFFPEPDRFAPERYIERWGKPFPQKAGNYAFGAGRRVCPGQHIAERALFIAMSTLLHHFTFDVARDPKTGRELKPDIFSFTDGFNSRPETFEAVIKPRRGQQTIDLLRKERDAAKEDLMRFDV